MNTITDVSTIKAIAEANNAFEDVLAMDSSPTGADHAYEGEFGLNSECYYCNRKRTPLDPATELQKLKDERMTEQEVRRANQQSEKEAEENLKKSNAQTPMTVDRLGDKAIGSSTDKNDPVLLAFELLANASYEKSHDTYISKDEAKAYIKRMKKEIGSMDDTLELSTAEQISILRHEQSDPNTSEYVKGKIADALSAFGVR